MIVAVCTYLFALFLFVGCVAHIVQPEIFDGFIPGFIPKPLANGLAAAAEFVIAAALVLSRTRALGGLMAAALCLAYMPFHVWDLFRPDPVVAPLWVAMVRLLLQFVFIWFGLHLWSRGR
ncbi:MAG: hypothetical protein AB3N23_14060 [Paracoccaceae bacterium]